jgi:hypothetical protein
MFPQHFSQTILELYGSKAAAWLESLPERMAACERRWYSSWASPTPSC